MCGRIALYAEAGLIADMFGADPADLSQYRPGYNIAPGQPVAIAYQGRSGPRMGQTPWGVPMRNNQRPIINARAETAAERPTFRQAYAKHRCAVPVNGFYEWQADGRGGKQPYWLSPPDDQPAALAGLVILQPEPALVIMTCAPNDLMTPIHHRMPALLQPADYQAWLDPETDPEQVAAMTAPRPWPDWSAVKVSRAVNDAHNDDDQLIQAV